MPHDEAPAEVSEKELTEAEAQLPDDHPVLRALRAERAKRKSLSDQLERTRDEADKFLELKSRFPWLERKHLKGREIEEWADWASELNEFRGASESASEGASATDEAPAVARAEESELAKAQAVTSGRAEAPTASQLTPREAMKQGLSPAEVVKGIREGTISLVNTSVEQNSSPFSS